MVSGQKFYAVQGVLKIKLEIDAVYNKYMMRVGKRNDFQTELENF